MANRILSGALNTSGSASGNVTILFDGHTATGDLNERHHGDKKNIGGTRGNFSSAPCSIISMRKIKIHETESRPSEPKHEIDNLRISDNIYSDRLEIKWSGSGNSRIEAIAYMVIGE